MQVVFLAKFSFLEAKRSLDLLRICAPGVPFLLKRKTPVHGRFLLSCTLMKILSLQVLWPWLEKRKLSNALSLSILQKEKKKSCFSWGTTKRPEIIHIISIYLSSAAKQRRKEDCAVTKWFLVAALTYLDLKGPGLTCYRRLCVRRNNMSIKSVSLNDCKSFQKL